jgi:hydroxymethylbilane synthase
MHADTPSFPLAFRLGSRGSKLALIQAEMAARVLREKTGKSCEIVTVKTTGDQVQDRPLAEIGGKALFAKEIEEALLDGRIDFAVHSLKDLPAELPEGLQLSAVLPRETPFDVLVLPEGSRLHDLPAALRLGTSSVRRIAQARRAWPQVHILPLRGNVDTRLAKLDGGDFDAVILAAAGLHRLGREARIHTLLDSARWLPALGQGAIGIETRKDAVELNLLLESISHPASHIAVACERGFQRGLGGSCRSPIAGLAEILGGVVIFRGEVLAPDGSDFAETRFETVLSNDWHGDALSAEQAGFAAGQKLRPRVRDWL